jgi:TonB family protein
MSTQTKFKENLHAGLIMLLTGLSFALLIMPSCGNEKQGTAAKIEAASMALPQLQEMDKPAQFRNGEEGLIDFIARNVEYPAEAKKNGITGKVMVKFVIEKNCSVSNVEIAEGVDPLLDAEAIRVVSSLPDFEKPATKAGEPARVQYLVPIQFSLK